MSAAVSAPPLFRDPRKIHGIARSLGIKTKATVLYGHMAALVETALAV